MRVPRRRPAGGRLAFPTAMLLLSAAACTRLPSPSAPPAEVVAEKSVPALFRDATPGSGVDFAYRNGEEAGHYSILEVIGGGLAVLDFDGDGLLDLFLPGGGHYEGPDKHQIKGNPCRLYRNLGGFRFEDITAKVGLDAIDFYTHGAAAADYDNDGWPDLLVTGWHRLALFHNEPVDPRDPSRGRRFTEVSKRAGFPEGLWTTGAAWGDLDGDGYADLYVCQYVDWSFEHNHPTDCSQDGKTRDICSPKRFTGLEHKLFRNRGDGTFEDVGKAAGLRAARTDAEYDQLDWLDARAKKRLREGANEALGGFGSGLGVVMVDVNGDGRPDIYVANDMRDNFLYLNRTRKVGSIRLEERGLESGTARNATGLPDASMGVDAADYDGSGRASLWATNNAGELHALYRNECQSGREYFLHVSGRSGIAVASRNTVGWGTGFLDIDHHGWEDLFLTAGDAYLHSTALPRAQKPVLLRNEGYQRFTDISAWGGAYFQEPRVGRGAVLGDFDNDGRIDLVVSYLNAPVTLLRNEADTGGHHWFGVELRGADSHDVVGARVMLEAGGRTQTRFAKGGGSYLSSSDRRHVFGLGTAGRIDRLRVEWPSGRAQQWQGLPADGYWRLNEGQERPVPLPSPNLQIVK
jgi:hypothetical protein